LRFGLRNTSLIVAVCLLATALSAFLLSASAGHVPVADPNDTRGPLDIRSVEVVGAEKPRWKVTTWSRWTTAQVFDYGYGTIYLDTVATPRPDYYILVGSAGTHMYAHLYRDRAMKSDLFLGELDRVGRGDKRSFFVRIALKRLDVGRQRAFYRWRAESLFTGEGCRNVCFDPAPNEGFVSEPLPIETPGPTPTPSITVTPTPTPSSS
jgi:hypothetical protein